MTTSDADDASWMDDFLEELAAEPVGVLPDWADPEDLSRLHVQAFVREQAGGFELSRSRGTLRLTGPGVLGHTLNLADAGVILAGFQNLVTSAGASTEGVTHSRGRIPAEIVERTRLVLNASPQPGSVILDFEPAVNEALERYPGGQATVEEIKPLVETSVDIAFEILSLASNSELNALAQERFPGWGPRVASAARYLAEAAAKANLDLTADWERPSEGRKRVVATADQLAQLWGVLQSKSLDTHPEEIEGILRTVSDRRKIELEVELDALPSLDDDSNDVPDHPSEVVNAVISAAEGAEEPPTRVIAIQRGKVDFTGFGLGDRVIMKVGARALHRPGSPDTEEYTAVGIRRAES